MGWSYKALLSDNVSVTPWYADDVVVSLPKAGDDIAISVLLLYCFQHVYFFFLQAGYLFILTNFSDPGFVLLL